MEVKRKPLVSIIVPNYCHSKYLDERMRSILAQTYNNFEVIILDDCSPDNGASKTVIEKYRGNSHVAHIVYNDNNSGSTFKQWDKGIKLAKGEFIWIAESDDTCESTMLEELITPILSNDKVSISFCRSVTFTNDKFINKVVGPKTIKTGCFNGVKFIHDFMKSGNAIVNASSAIFRKSAFELIGDEYKAYRGAGDRLFWIYLAEKGDVCFDDKPLNYFRQHIRNTTTSCNVLGINQKEDKRILDYILKKGYITRSEYAKIVKSYVTIHIYQMVNDEKLKRELYNVWGVNKMEQINMKYETLFPKISVIMPVFNVCQYLGGQLKVFFHKLSKILKFY